MDFAIDENQRELVERILKFTGEHLGRPSSASAGFDAQRWRQCGEFGLLGLCAPVEHGGLGLDALSTALAMEAFGRGCEDFGLVFSAAAHLFACVCSLVHHGSPELKDRYLGGLCRGTLVGANAISEAGAGSDVQHLATRAIRDGNEYVLDGVKTYVTNGPVADLFIVYATTRPEDGLFGTSAFAIPRDTPGLLASPPYVKHGLESAPLGTLQLDACRVPESFRVGREGRGRAVFMTSMVWERSCLFAGYLGAMERQLEKSIEYARERRQFDRPISSFQAVSHRIVDMKLRLESARLLTYRACWAIDRGERHAVREVALAKLAVSEAAVESALDSIRIHGGMGVVAESGVGRALWEAVPSLIFSGTSEIQRELIARELGM